MMASFCCVEFQTLCGLNVAKAKAKQGQGIKATGNGPRKKGAELPVATPQILVGFTAIDPSGIKTPTKSPCTGSAALSSAQQHSAD